MIATISRLWRAFATGLGFVIFGLGCAMLAPTVLPVIMLWPGTAEQRQWRARALVGIAFRGLLILITFLGFGRIHAEGLEHLDEESGRLILASHPCFLDVVALVAMHPQADCVVKQALWRNPFTRAFVQTAGYISNDDPVALIDTCVKVIEDGGDLIIFPEGTRTRARQPLSFKRGAAQIAIRANARIVPVLITCDPPALTKELRWYEVPDRAWQLRLRVLPPRGADEFLATSETATGVRVRNLTHSLQTFFQQQLMSHEHA